MKRIAIDAMGGDAAPQAIIEGVLRARDELSDVEFQVYGDQEQILPLIENADRIEIVHTKEKIEGDDEPTRAIRRKKDASMVLAAKAVKDGQADALLSAGNTGALLAAAFFIIGRIKGIDRPGLLTTLPSQNGQGFVMMDLGANAESSPKHLEQYALMGSFYASQVRGIQNPRVGLLNNGSEAGKGDSLRKEAYELLAAREDLNFIGNVEARDLMSQVADVVVTDGFTGNAVLKTMEGTALGILSQLKSTILAGGLRAKLGAWLLKPSLQVMRQSLDYTEAGGAMLFGVKAPVVKAHGSSDAKSIYYTIKQVASILESQIVDQAKEVFQADQVEKE
ncbi:phosphate acyltransferase PlsX [Streptococcus danieliae]|uniref:Phosphate acyltransferase n=1 Tax=Streptococcus danieliae TaxID=747656 RepID=A0A7Z0S5U8_9STRE|nr:phosphate acyltransferase PlsX [Streptococcus danieliae]MBF0700311.1 phosphate acyltransferase PlsX [Streptococcus danieliae]NYS97487.1 phosphate acyltransferase PlsX [Streptococcus danieliae]